MGWRLGGQSLAARALARLRRPELAEQAAPTLAIVQRDLSPAYYFFIDIFGKQNGLEIIVDRRVQDRRKRVTRVFGERRASDRRGPVPLSWDQGDIVILRPEHGPPDAPVRVGAIGEHGGSG